MCSRDVNCWQQAFIEHCSSGVDGISIDKLDGARVGEEPIHRQLKQQRGILNDIHKRVVALAEALEQRSASK